MRCLALLALFCLVFGQVEQFNANLPQQGEGTYYNGGASGGHCSIWPVPSFVTNSKVQRVAMNNLQYINGDQSRGCGMCVKIWGTGSGSGGNPYPVGKENAILAWVDDECPECKQGDIDTNKQPGDGRFGIQWVAVDCPVEGGLQYMFQGSHNYYMKLQVRNHKIPVKSLEFKSGSTWYTGVRQPDNHFLAPSGFPFPCNPTSTAPLEVRITGLDGTSVIDTISSIPTSNGVVLNGGKNVQLGSLGGSTPKEPVTPPKVPVTPPTVPVTPPKVPVTPPTVPVTPPKVPVAPPTTSTGSCGNTKYAYASDWWVEINAAAGKTVKVKCPNGMIHSCEYKYEKYQCGIATEACKVPRSAIVDNVECPLDGQAPVAPPTVPVTPPTVPVTPPKVPVTPPTTSTCSGVSSPSQSDWWIEVQAPSLSSTVSIICNSGQTVACEAKWGKHVCDTKGVQCTAPRKAKVDNGTPCPLGAAARMEDDSDSGFPAGAIAGIVVAGVVLAALVIGAVLFFGRRAEQEERF